jgi:flagellar hook-associated protein 2
MSSTSAINSLLSSSTASSTPAINISSILAGASGATTPGIDVTSAVAAGIYADRAPERAWAAEQVTLTSQTTALTAIQTATTALTTDMNSLNSLTGPLSTRTVTSSDANVTATAAAGTVAGVDSVDVISTAQTGAWYSDEASSPTATIPATSFTITSGTGSTVASATFSTGGTSGVNSLNALAAAINAQTTTLGVNATVVTDATGSRLAILSNTSGTAANFSISSTNYTGTSWSSPDIPTGGSLGANSITLSSGSASATIATTVGESYATLASAINATVPSLNITASAVTDANGTHISLVSTDGTTPFSVNQPSFGFTQAVVGADADLTVNGVPITSATNTVTGALPGVTLTLLGPTTGSANLTVASNASAISTVLNQFVTDYNSAVNLVNAQFQFSSTTNAEGVLASDPTVQSLQAALASALNFVAPPATGNTTTTAPTLDSIGISVTADGTLSVDSTTLDAALINNPADVQNLFQGASLNGFAASVNTALDNFTDPSNGAFTLDLQSIATTNTGLTTETTDFETNYIAGQQTILTAMYSAAEIALQSLPAQMAQLNAELGNSPSNSSGG